MSLRDAVRPVRHSSAAVVVPRRRLTSELDRGSWERPRNGSSRLPSCLGAACPDRAEHYPLLVCRRRCRSDCLPTGRVPVRLPSIPSLGVPRLRAPLRGRAWRPAGRCYHWSLAPRDTDSARQWPRRRCGRVSAGRDAWDVDVRSCHFDEKMVVGPPARPHRVDCLLRKIAGGAWVYAARHRADTRGRNRSASRLERAVRTRRDVAGSMRRDALLCLVPLGADCSRGAGNHGAAARRFSWPVNRSSANRATTPFVSGRADDVAVVPADAYEYRHERKLAQPWSCTVC